jgi:hypothetical protein
MLPFDVTIPATVPEGSEITEGLMNNPVFISLSSGDYFPAYKYFGLMMACIGLN